MVRYLFFNNKNKISYIYFVFMFIFFTYTLISFLIEKRFKELNNYKAVLDVKYNT